MAVMDALWLWLVPEPNNGATSDASDAYGDRAMAVMDALEDRNQS
eukprot:CAMPEP_0184502962 /NCGR_PEP_ID=MMETSP0113_2-20130426/51591_1 /TAXON_ID=91329 /ORGANISM="Norrisiella sphaerica, Strain BC52" /LENGTH=44 /DNA_ID= /DNA_START= /DNA_END= /DNA_ORIENTATION=